MPTYTNNIGTIFQIINLKDLPQLGNYRQYSIVRIVV